MTSAVGFTGTSVSALYQILAEKDQPDGYVGLDANGKIPVQYLPDEIPKDFTDVEIKTNKNQPNGYPGLDAGGQLAASVIPPGAYVLSSSVGQQSGVAGLDATSKLYAGNIPFGTTAGTVAEGSHSHAGQFVLETQRNLPNGFAGLNGSGKLAIAQIPTGTTSTTVAVGNHAHAGQFEPIINPKRTAFNKEFGIGAGQVAEGNHNHDAGDIVTGTVPYSRLPVGAVANTVAAGNHNHLISSVTGLQAALDSKSNAADFPYSSGSFVPSLRFLNDDSDDWVYSEQFGFYFRDRDFVFVGFSVVLSQKATAGSNALEIIGLPFLTTDTFYFTMIWGRVTLGAGVGYIPSGYTTANTRIRLSARSVDSNTPYVISGVSNLEDNSFFRGQFCYMI